MQAKNHNISQRILAWLRQHRKRLLKIVLRHSDYVTVCPQRLCHVQQSDFVTGLTQRKCHLSFAHTCQDV